MEFKKAVLNLLFFLSLSAIRAQENLLPRVQFSINDNWRFKPYGVEFVPLAKTDVTAWEGVDLPHTWNANDPFDDDGTYRRGISWYRKSFTFGNRFKGKRIYILFEGANQVSDVYVNGAFAGRHKGGYTAFNFDITEYIKLGEENIIAVQVNNAQDNFIPPLSVGYALYGGIYRDTWIIALNSLHFSLSDHASGGIYISTPKVNAKYANVSVKSLLVNEDKTTKSFDVIHTVYDADNNKITSVRKAFTLALYARAELSVNTPEISSPELWSPEKPYLYTVKSQIIENGKVVDEVTNPLGFRWYSFNAATGFSLNGKKYILKGTNRHQDFKGKGSALTNEDHYRDLKIIKDMGCNFLRLAHYPQDPEVLRLADKMGLLIWEEVPVVNYINPDPGFLKNAQETIREMVRQNYNHPSIIIWGSMNEVLLYSKNAERIQVQTDTVYLNQVKKFAEKTDSTVRVEDPSRYSTMAMHLSEDYEKFGLTEIPRIAGWNVYSGWYSGEVEGFGKIFDKKHKDHPGEIILISEYGAGSDEQINTENPQRLDFSGEYQRYYHESYLSQIKKRPYFAGTAIWNEFDFSQPNVGGTLSHLNQKGMVSWDRIPKDVYYLYKANWNPGPMVYIATRDWLHRGGKSGAPSTIDAYSNLENVQLYVNGKAYPTQKGNDVNKFSWKVNLTGGKNILIAKGTKNGKPYTDQVTVYYTVFDDNLNTDTFSSIAINAGSDTQYIDDSKMIWINDRPYKKGSYGYTGGIPSMLDLKSLITHTEDTPLFYSYINDIKGYKLDVPRGRYEVELCFAEPDNINTGERVFDVDINGLKVESGIDLSKESGFAVAAKKKYIIETKYGISISFIPVRGKAVLNGLKVTRL